MSIREAAEFTKIYSSREGSCATISTVLHMHAEVIRKHSVFGKNDKNGGDKYALYDDPCRKESKL